MKLVRKKKSNVYSISSIKSQDLKPKTKKYLEIGLLQKLFRNVSKYIDERTEESIDQLKNYLMENHPFFLKVHPLIIQCILKLSNFYEVKKNTLIYKAGTYDRSFYIIICGRVKIMNNRPLNFKFFKVCKVGDIFGEEGIFEGKKTKRKESAVAVKDCMIIEVKYDEYWRLK